MADASASAYKLEGPWVGETVGHDSPAHIWEIKIVRPIASLPYASIFTRWEGETKQARFDLWLEEGEGDARLRFDGHGSMVWVDGQHFVVPKWDTNEVRDHKGPAYDVVFSRPGIPELTAHDAYQRYLKTKAKPKLKRASKDDPKRPRKGGRKHA